jgi:hypothetical protein
MFATQAEAKRFFVERVLAQARAEQLQLSPAEQGMLSWSESDPSFTPDPALVEQLATEVSDEEYEGKIAGLLERSYRHDLTADSANGDRYREAYSVLTRGDHYLVVMIRRALGRYLRPWWAPWR